MEKILGEIEYDKLIGGITVSNKNWGIGIGDLTCYSILVSNTSANFGILTGVVSLIMILIGSLLSHMMSLRQGRFPGLPITMVLGLIPLIISLFLM